MEKVDLTQLIGLRTEPRYMEYNWRDIALYALAVGAKAEDLQYTYEKVLKALPTYGTIPYWGECKAVSMDAAARLHDRQRTDQAHHFFFEHGS